MLVIELVALVAMLVIEISKICDSLRGIINFLVYIFFIKVL